jgi:hypothetical protein
MMSLLLVSSLCVIAVLAVLSLVPRLKDKTKSILFAIGFISVFVMSLTIQLIKGEPNGKALTEFSINGVYFVEWVQVNGPVVSMKLNMGEKSLSLYYEIAKEKIVFWDGEEKDFPVKFRVITDKEDKVYALLAVK